MSLAHVLVEEDVRNNSAWNQRWFASHRGRREPLSEEVGLAEADYAIGQIRMDPYNESSWRYLIAVAKEQQSLVPTLEQRAVAVKEILEKAGRDPEACVNLNSARIDLLQMKGDEASIREAIDLAQVMATDYDLIRKKYWDLRTTELETNL